MQPTVPAPAKSRLDALRITVVEKQRELERRIMHLLAEKDRDGTRNSAECHLLDQKIIELIEANKDLETQLEYKGKKPFGMFKNGVIEAAKCLAESRGKIKEFHLAINSVVPEQYRLY